MVQPMKKCKYCNIKHGTGEFINNNGDEFLIMHEQGEKYRIATNNRNHFCMLKIKFCPMCGRRLKKGESE